MKTALIGMINPAISESFLYRLWKESETPIMIVEEKTPTVAEVIASMPALAETPYIPKPKSDRAFYNNLPKYKNKQ